MADAILKARAPLNDSGYNNNQPVDTSMKVSSKEPAKSTKSSGKNNTGVSKGKQKAHTPVPSTSGKPTKTPHAGGDIKSNDIYALLIQIRQDQNQQATDIKSLSERVNGIACGPVFENFDCESLSDYTSDQPQYDYLPPETLETKETESASNKSNMIKAAVEKIKTKEICDISVNLDLACCVNNWFRNGVEPIKYAEMSKEGANCRPINCVALTTVIINHLIWDLLSSETRANDKKLQAAEHSLLRGASLLTHIVHQMGTDYEADTVVDSQIFVDKSMQALALFGHANRQINMFRRDLIRPELKGDYSHLCSHTAPFTTELFGDNITKFVNQIEDRNLLIPLNMQPSVGGCGVQGKPRGQSRGRARGGSPIRGRSLNRGTGRGLLQYSPRKSPYPTLRGSKNGMQRGGHGTTRRYQ